MLTIDPDSAVIRKDFTTHRHPEPDSVHDQHYTVVHFSIEVTVGYRRYIHKKRYETEEEATPLLVAVANAHRINPQHWTEGRLTYGAPGCEEEMLHDEFADARWDGERHPLDIS